MSPLIMAKLPTSDKSLGIAALMNSGIVVSASATGSLSGDLFQLFALTVLGVSPAFLGLVLGSGLVIGPIQAWIATHPWSVRDALALRRGFGIAAVGALILALSTVDWHS